MEGLNVTVDIFRRHQDSDDAVGGSVRSDTALYSGIRARISNALPNRLLVEQGIEVEDIHEIIIYPDSYQSVQEEDIVVPVSGRLANTRLKVIGFQPSSLRLGEERSHIQLHCQRLRYADENVPE